MATKNSQTEIDYVKQMKSTKIPLKLKLLRSYIKVVTKISKDRGAKLITKLFLTPQRKVLRPDQLEYYRSGRIEFIEFKKQKIFVFTKGKGPRILLAHGWGSNSYIFKYIIDSLIDEGYSIVTVDYPAHGQSSGKQTTLVETSELLKLMFDKFGSFEAIVAYSFGGPTTLRAMELGVETKNLILLSAPSRIESIFGPFFDLLDISVELQELFIQELVAQTGINRDRISPINMNFDRTTRSLIIHDKEDEIIPYADAQTINKHLEKSTLVLTNNLGHRGVPRTEAVVTQITEFIKSSELKIVV